MAARQNLGSVLVVGGCEFLGHRIVAQLIYSDTKPNRGPNYHPHSIPSAIRS